MSTLKERGINLPWGMDDEAEDARSEPLAESKVEAAVESEEDDALEFGRADEEVTTRVDVSGHLDEKRRTMDCHKTQRQDLGWLLDLPPDLADGAIDTEFYVLRWLDGRDVPTSTRETWLLATDRAHTA